MSYNIERMRELFKKNLVREDCKERLDSIASTILNSSPHILGIVEGSDRQADHDFFLNNTVLKELDYKIAKSDETRGKQDLLFYYRDPFEVVSIDENIDFYQRWIEDIDGDTIDEVMQFERKPMEVIFVEKRTGRQILVILISFKSKGVFSVNDIHSYEHIALANRKKLHGQSKKVRERMDELLKENPDREIIVMGDLNDEPGMDYFQKQVGASAVETIIGNIYSPELIFHCALLHIGNGKNKYDLWTTVYPDPIVANLKKHKAWLDHIFISPGMIKGTSKIKYVKDSGFIAPKNKISQIASDHYPVGCEISVE